MEVPQWVEAPTPSLVLFVPFQDPHGGRREPPPISCPMNSIPVLWQACGHTHTEKEREQISIMQFKQKIE